MWSLAAAHTCDRHAVVLFILGEKPSEGLAGARGQGDGGIEAITEQMWCW